MDRGSTELARTLGDAIRHGKDLFRLFIEQEVVVAEVRPTHVPVEVFGLQIKDEDVCQQGPQAGAYPLQSQCGSGRLSIVHCQRVQVAFELQCALP